MAKVKYTFVVEEEERTPEEISLAKERLSNEDYMEMWKTETGEYLADVFDEGAKVTSSVEIIE